MSNVETPEVEAAPVPVEATKQVAPKKPRGAKPLVVKTPAPKAAKPVKGKTPKAGKAATSGKATKPTAKAAPKTAKAKKAKTEAAVPMEFIKECPLHGAVAGETAAPVSANNPLHKGGMRMRLFKALKKFDKGLSQRQIKEKCALVLNSGSLGAMLLVEIERKRIRAHDNSDNGESISYTLTAAGVKALADDTVDARKVSGDRTSRPWTKVRAAAEIASKK